MKVGNMWGKTVERTGGEDPVLSDLVRLVQSTYSETMPVGDGRGLARLEQGLHRVRRPFLREHRRVLVAAIATLTVVAGGAFAYRQFQSLTYEVMNGAVGPGGFVRSTAPDATILFSEGSEITLGEAARARVDNLTSDGGHVVVESGSVHARIVHRKHARWFVDAGPYTIQVTGTAFNVKWSWEKERLDIRMDRGSVVVTGPLAPAGVTLTGGMRLMVTPASGLSISGNGVSQGLSQSGNADSSGLRDNVREPVPAGTAPAGENPGEQPADEDSAATSLADPSPAFDGASAVLQKHRPATRERAAMSAPGQRLHQGPGAAGTAGTEHRLAALAPGSAHQASDPDATPQAADPSWSGNQRWAPEQWDKRLARGDVQEILDDAAAVGIANVLTRASGRQLSALADAARYGHQPALARRVLLSIRERFPRSGESRDAAFFLGGLAEDATGGGGPAAALDWYDRYLSETVQGRYAPQALGRKMVMMQKLKGTEAARAVAIEYLDRFPGGPYAFPARKMIR
ncbi:MAG: FecR domain-containing protein [Myxococcales bacterium]